MWIFVVGPQVNLTARSHQGQCEHTHVCTHTHMHVHAHAHAHVCTHTHLFLLHYVPPSLSLSSPRLLDLVEHKPIGGKEFLPLSGQALLGFRLLPGPVSIYTCALYIQLTEVSAIDAFTFTLCPFKLPFVSGTQ